ncbi:acyl-coenzyme a oxidase [Suhomyces tanzawaensis NRRL Y-17324]|uniref:Acyl-coenzyme A oxidase n=1 Tax=Suhomyces tanzawaensis NRRL Y-17324 TaxID=984487 RepID=A0A1E4SGB1_9ASCO|nr:acyl-coenzyme a oxidase [Suhomyces tanzawaensis NRRL Y-17324]ODV78505.1 acyl-coenzyme a oxidase [Suhomyces tanzawaensis NRRL Y-17324]
MSGPKLFTGHDISITNTGTTSPGPNPALLIAEERSRTNFNLTKMHHFIEGNPAKAEQILRIYKSLERDVILQSNLAHYDNDKLTDRELTAKRIARLTQYIEIESSKQFFRRLNLLNVYDPSTGIRISVNLGLFLNGVRGNGTADQYKFWAKKMEAGIMKQLYGCFGMTELGHGSNVAGMETTATFDEDTDEFIIDTPHIGATKWWIGGAAHSATHSVVYARLLIKGKDYGVKTFVVPLRDSNHNLFPGVSIGDIGAKMGRQGVDNGWIQFSDVRIPRYFMLQKWCKVSRDGTVALPPLEQLSYISLLEGRVTMAVDSYRIGARFTTVALRYGVGRRQFKNRESDEYEKKILDYTLHQKRLLPNLALTYAMAVGTDRLEEQHEKVILDLDTALLSKDKKKISEAILGTKSLFVDSGSMKSTLTWLGGELIDEARQSCGGHGYSSYNGFGKAYNDWAVQCTWEGDNNVLAMSAGRTIMKNIEQIIVKKKPIDPNSTFAFLNNANEVISSGPIIKSESDLKDLTKVREAVEAVIIRYAAENLQVLKDTKGNWDALSPQRVELSKLRAHHYLLESFERKLASLNKSDDIYPHLVNLIQLYFTTSIFGAFTAQFLRFDVYESKIAKYIGSTFLSESLAKVRPYVIGLTDAFQQPDNMLNSVIGNYDGQIYENYLDAVKNINPIGDGKPPYVEALTNMLDRGSIPERDRFEKSDKVKDILSN